MKKIVTFGELLLSLATRDHERFVQADVFSAKYTGAEANVAASLALFGMEAFAVSKVPAHEIGQACVNYLRRYGVNTDYIVRGGERLGLLYLEHGASQRPSKVIYDRAHSSIREARSDEFDWPAIFQGRDWFHFSGTTPALGDNVIAVLKDALRAARDARIVVSCDCNYRSKLWDTAAAGKTMTDLLEYVDVFICGREDARKLFGIAGETGEEAALAMRRQFKLARAAMTLRRGESASLNSMAGLLCDESGCYTSRTYDMQIVDRVGGGDAFSAGLICGLLSEWAPQRTVEFAAAASCLKHSLPGDFNLVSLEEVEQLLAGDQSGRVQR